MVNFASDNSAPAHPKVIEKVAAVNTGAAASYGADSYTRSAEILFKKEFGDHAETFFVFNGTGANTVALDALTDKYDMILTAPAAHITVDECGAPTKITGCPINFVCNTPRKITPQDLAPFMEAKGNIHHSQPHVLSISQVTEMGEIYRVDELKAIRKFCDDNGLCFHMDGARIANAAAKLGCTLKDAAYGADILSFGGTKNGIMLGEAIVVLNPAFKERTAYLRKQNMQLASKMRYISAQFTALLEDGLWLKNAEHANSMTELLYSKIKHSVNIIYPVEANMIFAEMPSELVKQLLERFYFYPMSEKNGRTTVRLMCSWDTGREDVESLAAAINGK